jgi:uncharacterized GH25 family protein
MKRIIGLGLSALALSVFAAPHAQAIRPELLPVANQSVQTVERTQNTESQPQVNVAKMKPAQTQPEMKTEKMPQPQESTFEYFERLYKNTYGS